MMTKLSEKEIIRFTLIYLIKGKKVLLIKRSANKRLLPNKLVGLGGKIEENENLYDSAKREFYEETGLKIKDPSFRGSYIWVDNDLIGISHLIVASKFSGILQRNNVEGELGWYDIKNVDSLADLASYQINFLPDILLNENYFYSGIGIFNKDKLLDYKDSNQSFR